MSAGHDDHGHGHHEHWSKQYVDASKNVLIQMTLLFALFLILLPYIHH